MTNPRRTPGTGLVQINQHITELPEAEARTLFLAAVAMTKRSGALAISPHITVAITAATQVSITIADGFVDEYEPEKVLSDLTRGRTAVIY